MLSIDVDEKLQLDLQRDIIGRRIAILGVSGQGKTNTAAVLIEELLSQGLPLTIVDLEGEYWGLKEKYQILVAGSGDHADFRAGPAEAGALAQLSLTEALSVILDLSEFAQAEYTDFLLEYFGALWAAAGRTHKPYQVVIEEAHEFVPEGTRTPLKDLLTQVALRGRKRGLGAILVSQRSQKVAKDVLTQAEMYFLHRVAHPIDRKVYETLIPKEAKEVGQMIGQLTPGHVLFVYNHEVEQVAIRLRHTFHAGATPTLDAQVAARLQTIDETLLAKLAEMSKASAGRSASQSDKEYQQARKIKELEAQNAQLQAEVEELRAQVKTLKDLKVSLEGSLPVAVQQAGAVASLPDSVRLERMEVGQLVTASSGGTAAPFHSSNHRQEPAPAAASKEAPPPLNFKPSAPAPLVFGQAEEFNEYEWQRFNPTLRRVQRLSKKEKIVLRLLVERDGYFLAKASIQKAVGFDLSNFKYQLTNIYQLPFFQDKGVKGVKTTLSAWAKEVFPRVKPAVVVEQINKAVVV